MTTREEQLARCLNETRSLTRTAEAMRVALENGDAKTVGALVEAQEVGIWRLGRLMQGEDVECAIPLDSETREILASSCELDRPDATRQIWMTEMARLADVCRQNAVLVRDGLVMVQGLLRILTGRSGEYGGGASGPIAFSRRA